MKPKDLESADVAFEKKLISLLGLILKIHLNRKRSFFERIQQFFKSVLKMGVDLCHACETPEQTFWSTLSPEEGGFFGGGHLFS